MEPTAPTPPADTPPTPDRARPWAAILLGALAAVLAVVLVVMVTSDDDEDVTADSTTTTVAEDTTTTTEATTSTTDEATTTSTTTTAPGGLPDAEAASVVWPDPAGDVAYDDPLDAVAGVAEDLLGFVDPVYGEFMAGDSRSGEVEVRALDTGPATLVAVRQMSDGNWYALFAASSEVELDEPTAGSAVDDPLLVSGRARAFEGQVRIAVFERGDDAPLGEDVVTAGSGEELESFTGEIAWTNPGGGWGVVIASTEGGPDGTTWAATAVPVGFIGGD